MTSQDLIACIEEQKRLGIEAIQERFLHGCRSMWQPKHSSDWNTELYEYRVAPPATGRLYVIMEPDDTIHLSLWDKDSAIELKDRYYRSAAVRCYIPAEDEEDE